MDTIANLLVSLRNAQAVRKPSVKVLYSKMNQAILQILDKKGFVAGLEKAGRKDDKYFEVKLKYAQDNAGAIREASRISRPGKRVYAGYQELKWPTGSLLIVSTPEGVMTGDEAKKKKLGGELICLIF